MCIRDRTGAGEEIATAVIGILGKNPSPYVLTFVVFMLCCVLTNFMSNTANTALLVPICVSIATEIGADPSAVLMAGVIGGSCAYATPIGIDVYKRQILHTPYQVLRTRA